MKTLAQVALVAALLTGLNNKAFALAESFVGTYQAAPSKHCVPNTLTVVRTQKSVELKLRYANKAEPQVIRFTYGHSREISGGGQLQNFITAPSKETLRLVRSETDFRNHPVSVFSITLTKTPTGGLKFQSVARNASETPMSCTYKSGPAT